MYPSRLLRAFVLLALLAISVPSLRGSVHAQDDPDIRCFPETGECIAGAIRVYWEENGGLSVFGYPITPLRIETIDGWSGPTQWFQRDRLEDHGAAGVLAGRLGAELLALEGRPWQSSFARVDPLAVPPSCQYIAATGHSLCEPFLSYWAQNGDVARFGYPITEPMQETIGDWTGTVQYFERRRMELHAEQIGLPILLGLLGSEVLNFSAAPLPPQPDAPGTPGTPAPPEGLAACVDAYLGGTSLNSQRLRRAYEQVRFREVMGCPTAYVAQVPAAVQVLERGEMLWVDMRASIASNVPFTLNDRFIFTLFNPGPTYQRYQDTWVAGVDPMRPNLRAPRSGLYPPWGGFGKLWINDSTVRDRLGWAVEPRAREGNADIVIFDNVYNDLNNLGMLVLFEDSGAVYAFGRLDMPSEAQVIYTP